MKSRLKSIILSIRRLHAWILRRTRSRSPAPAPSRVKKILLCNAGHLGDMIMFRTIIPYVRHNYPDAEIGVLVGSWNHHMLSAHPDVSHIHHIDQVRHNRSKLSWIGKVCTEMMGVSKAISEIREIGYDVAVDTYHFIFNNTRHLWSSGIPIRIGFDSSGYESLLTHVARFKSSTTHEVNEYLNVLRLLHGDWPSAIGRYSELSDIRKSYVLPEPYIIFHCGAGDGKRLWSESSWSMLCDLVDGGRLVVFTGYGENEMKFINTVIKSSKNKRVLNLCSMLSMGEYIGLVCGAELLIGVESLSGHIAAACGVPSISLYSGLADPVQWAPLGDTASIIVSNPNNAEKDVRNMSDITPAIVREHMRFVLD